MIAVTNQYFCKTVIPASCKVARTQRDRPILNPPEGLEPTERTPKTKIVLLGMTENLFIMGYLIFILSLRDDKHAGIIPSQALKNLANLSQSLSERYEFRKTPRYKITRFS